MISPAGWPRLASLGGWNTVRGIPVAVIVCQGVLGLGGLVYLWVWRGGS